MKAIAYISLSQTYRIGTLGEPHIPYVFIPQFCFVSSAICFVSSAFLLLSYLHCPYLYEC
ncbi:hypothetical protein T4B_13376 [Trichinella pseudospiralis]|uniref:Uncharacterized protein n=1 Tax=Trichinella pseudospiralis TaxID=6337 RepID=A0A0V1GF73_TRIPS|nr:hypothetical protein T4B_13376 [Trichinella pseudospiralis]